MTYAQKIKKLREVLLITQQELASLLSVSIVTVNRWENSKYEPTMRVKRRLSQLFKESKIAEENEWKTTIAKLREE